MSKNDTHIETVQLISIIPEITQVIFQSPHCPHSQTSAGLPQKTQSLHQVHIILGNEEFVQLLQPCELHAEGGLGAVVFTGHQLVKPLLGSC